jgi:hypothetical protein
MKKILLFPLCSLLLICSVVVKAQVDYSPTNVKKINTTFLDISSTGTEIAMTHPETGNSTSPIDIGFDFTFNETVFNQCMIHADGVLRFGSVAPGSHTSLYANNGSFNGMAYHTNDANFQNVVYAFFMDLVQANQQPIYHVFTEGVAPNRVTTLQWKNLKDNSGSAGEGQFNELAFQIKLFETTNDIQIIYGDFVPSTNKSISRTLHVGTRASATVFIAESRMGSFSLFENAEFLGPTVNAVSGSGLDINNNFGPVNGFSFLFYGKRTVDIGIVESYLDHSVVKTDAARSSVNVKNEGRLGMNNISVKLEISGANTYTETLIIPTLAPAQSQIIDFMGYSLPNSGEQEVKFTVSATADENLANQSISKLQRVTNNLVQLANDKEKQSGGLGFNSSSNSEVAFKIFGSGTRKISQINVPFFSSNVGVSIRLYEDNGANGSPGTILGTAISLNTDEDNEAVFHFATPITVTDDFFVGIRQNGDRNMGWQIKYQHPLQPNRLYFRSTGSFTLDPVDRPYTPLLKVIEQTQSSDVGVSSIVSPLCGGETTTPVSVFIVNHSASDLDFASNPVTVSGSITNEKTNQIVPFSVVHQTGVLTAGQKLQVFVGLDYLMSDNAKYKIVARTQMDSDSEPLNDELIYVVGNIVTATISANEPVCPFTQVTLKTAPDKYTNVKWTLNGVTKFGETYTFSPGETSFVQVSATNHNGCIIVDSIKVEVKQTDLSPTPTIVATDTVLSYRNGFKTTFNVGTLANHEIKWIGTGTASAEGASYEIQGFKDMDPENHIVYYKNIDPACGSKGDTLSTRFATGVLMNNNMSEIVSDTSFYDGGGAIGAYIASGNFVKTFHPKEVGDKLKLSIYNILLGQSSSLEIYDGINTDAPRVARLDRLTPNALFEYMASNAEGAITVQFRGSNSSGIGWLAGITSEQPLQYRSAQNGLFIDASTWESKTITAGNYAPATRRPFKGDDLIEVLHDVRLEENSRLYLDQTTIETSGSLTVPYRATLELFSEDRGYELTVKGTLNVQEGYVQGSSDAGGAGKIALSGTLNLDGAIHIDTLVIIGAIAPVNLNTSGSAELSRLKMNNPMGLNLNGNLDIFRSLDLTNGIINLANTNYLRLRAGYGAQMLNGSATSFVNGKLRMQKYATSDSITFPIGKPGVFRRITLLANQSASESHVEYETELMNAAPPSRTLPATLNTVNQQWYHRLNIVNGGQYFTEATATIDYIAADGVTDIANLRLAKSDGNVNWIDLEGTATGNTSGSITSNIFDQLGDFVLGNVNPSTLSVTLVSFKAKLIGNTTQLNWVATSEENFKGYVVERSADGIGFEQVGWENAVGGNGLIRYNHSDLLDNTGVFYYRLKMTNNDGSFTFSNLVSVDSRLSVVNHQVRVLPNPFVNYVNLQYQAQKKGALTLQLIDVTGRTLKQNQYALNIGNNEVNFVTGELPKALYLLKIITDEGVWIEKILRD